MSVYLDHNATTPLDERVLEAMRPYLTTTFGNPSSLHRYGRAAHAAVELAREQVAALVGAHPSQVVFTGGGTEANNAALKGVAAGRERGRLAVSAIEHASVLDPASALERAGWGLEVIEVDAEGRVTAESLRAALRSDTRLVSIMAANNETGVLHDVAALAKVVRESGAVFHTDAIQACGKVAVDFAGSGAHLMTLSAHKLHGPKGMGALVVEKSVPFEPLVHGGGQEKGRRGGTENVAGIVGFGAAAELAMRAWRERGIQMQALRERLEDELERVLPEVVIFAKGAPRLPNTVFFAVPGVEGATLLMNLDRAGFAVSSGAACASGAGEPSHVLTAMGVPRDLARGAVRVSLGPVNTEADVDQFIAAVAVQCQALRAAVWN